MRSSFKLNQLTLPLGISFSEEEPKTVMDPRDREIYALRQQIQTLKVMYKSAKLQNASQKNDVKHIPENEFAKQRIEQLTEFLTEKDKQLRSLHQEANRLHLSSMEETHRERLDKQQALNEVVALHGQIESLKKKLNDSQITLKNLEEKHAQMRSISDTIRKILE